MSGRGICPPPLSLRYSAGGLTLPSRKSSLGLTSILNRVKINKKCHWTTWPLAAGQDLLITDPRGIWILFSDFYSSFTDKILLNKTISTINYDDNGVEVATTEGEVFTADFALCTFGTGVLDRGSVKFDPTLPGWKKEAIYRLRPVYYTNFQVNSEVIVSGYYMFQPRTQDISQYFSIWIVLGSFLAPSLCNCK